MKKLLIFIFSVCLIIPCMLLFSACANDPIQYKLSFVVDGEVYAVVDTAGEESISMPQNPIKEGYTFDGWYFDDGLWQNKFNSHLYLNARLTGDVNLYAKFIKNPVMITYHLGGGQNNSENITTLENDINLQLKNPTKEFFNFCGWFSDENFTNQISSLNFKNLIGNVNLYAKWEFDYLNYKYIEINAGSMLPTLAWGDIIIITKPAMEEIKVGDILTYQFSSGTPVTHRIIDIDENGYFYTQGDNPNNAPDGYPISYNKEADKPTVVGICKKILRDISIEEYMFEGYNIDNITWEYDANSHWNEEFDNIKFKHDFEITYGDMFEHKTCKYCGYTENVEHVLSNQYSFDANSHWYACIHDGCEYHSTKMSHTFENKFDDNYIWQKCKICGYETEKRARGIGSTSVNFANGIKVDCRTNYDVQKLNIFEKDISENIYPGQLISLGNINIKASENSTEFHARFKFEIWCDGQVATQQQLEIITVNESSFNLNWVKANDGYFYYMNNEEIATIPFDDYISLFTDNAKLKIEDGCFEFLPFKSLKLVVKIECAEDLVDWNDVEFSINYNLDK